MMRLLASCYGSLALIWAASFGAAGCAFSDGQPWGVASVDLDVYFAPGTARLTEQGRLKTARSFSLRLERFDLTLGALAMATDSSAPTKAFDPSDPPPGYSLCHDGHCHKDDGTLPTYAEIIAELDQQGGAGSVRLWPVQDLTPITSSPEAVELEACPNACEFEQSTVSALSLSVEQMHLRARVFDERAPDSAALPPEGIEIDLTVPLGITLSQDVDVVFGPGKELGARFQATLSIPPELFDDIDFSESASVTPSVFSEAVATAWAARPNSFSVTIGR